MATAGAKSLRHFQLSSVGFAARKEYARASLHDVRRSYTRGATWMPCAAVAVSGRRRTMASRRRGVAVALGRRLGQPHALHGCRCHDVAGSLRCGAHGGGRRRRGRQPYIGALSRKERYPYVTKATLGPGSPGHPELKKRPKGFERPRTHEPWGGPQTPPFRHTHRTERGVLRQKGRRPCISGWSGGPTA